MKCSTKRITPLLANPAISLWQKRNLLLFTISLFTFFISASAQVNVPITISGVVKDSSGVVLAKSTVAEKGTKNATTTDAGGNFTLKVAGTKSVLVVSTVGYATQQIRVDNKTAFPPSS